MGASYVGHNMGWLFEGLVEDDMVDSLVAAKWKVDVAGKASAAVAGRLKKEIAAYLGWVMHYQE